VKNKNAAIHAAYWNGEKTYTDSKGHFCYHHHHQISYFSGLAGKYSPILGCIINRIRLDGLMYNSGNFLQLNMCQKLPLFAFVCVCLGAG
jgi:hypothetical protein